MSLIPSKGRDFLRKAQFPLAIAMGTLPVALLILHGFCPDLLARLWIFPCGYVLLSWVCLLLPGRFRLLPGIAGAAGFVVLGLHLLPEGHHFLALLLPLMYAILTLCTLPMAGWDRDMELHPTWLVIFALGHAVGQFLVNIGRKAGTFPVFESAATALLLCFIGCLALCLLSLNRSTMQSASMGRQRIPVGMRRRNIIFSMAILLLILLLSAAPQIIRAVEQAGDALLRVIWAVLSFLASLMSRSSSGGGGGGGGDMDLSELGGEVAEPSLFAVFMEKVAFVVAIIAVVALLVFAAVKLYQKLRILLRYIAQRLSHYAHSASEDFEDEITDTRDEGERERISLMDTLRRRMLLVDEKKLTPAQRVRHRYLRLMLKHPEWHAGRTARETLPPDAASLYERVRYSEEDVSAEEADAFAQQTKSLP